MKTSSPKVAANFTRFFLEVLLIMLMSTSPWNIASLILAVAAAALVLAG